MSSLRAQKGYKTNTQNNTKTRRTPRRNRHLERKKPIFYVFSDRPKNVFIPASMT